MHSAELVEKFLTQMLQAKNPEPYQRMLAEAQTFEPGTAIGERTDNFLIREASDAARRYVIEYGGDYVEGVAINDFPLPWMHAWVVKDGKVIDPFWKEPGIFYHGIVIPNVLSKAGPFLWQ